ncbi:MAG: anti-sigma factor family protein [Ilumatobacteraceae bacterium]
MSGDIEHPAQCELIADELTELALGTLSGPRRSEVLEHVGSCQSCRAELDQLSIVVEALQQLAPRMQPPLGFELRLAEKLQGTAAPRPRRYRRVGVLSAAAVLVGVLAFGLGALVAPGAGNGRGQSAATNLKSASFTSRGHVLGDLLISAGSPAWMLVTIHSDGWQGTVTCDVTLSGGQVQTIGVFKLSGEYGVWAAPLPSTGGQVRSAQLIASDGTVLASAQVDS